MADKYVNGTGLSYFWGRIKALFALKAELNEGLATKVDKVTGKALSTNDYTTTEKNKLGGIETGAQVNKLEEISVNGTLITPSGKRVALTIPTKLSSLTNDTTYQTLTQVNTLIADAVGGITGFEFVIVETLPSTGEVGKIYLIADTSSSSNNYFEWAWINDLWELLGSTTVDLSGYWAHADLVAITTAEIDAITV